MMEYFNDGVFYTRHVDSERISLLGMQLSVLFAKGDICENIRVCMPADKKLSKQCCLTLASMLSRSLKDSRSLSSPWKLRYLALGEVLISYAAAYEGLSLWTRFYPGYLIKVLESAEAEHQIKVRKLQTCLKDPRAKQFLLAFHLGLSHVCYCYESRVSLIVPNSPDVIEQQVIQRIPARLRDLATTQDELSPFSKIAQELLAYGSVLLNLSDNFELPTNYSQN